MSDDITIGVTEIVNNIEVTAQPNDQIVDISVTDNADNVTLNITPTVIEINVNKGSSYAIWGAITGTLSSQTDLVNALNLRVPYTGATSNVNLGEYGLTSGFLGLDTTPTSTPTGIGTIYWDAANRTAALIDGDGDTTLQIGQEQRILVHNNTGSTLTDGQVVYVTGSTGNLPSVSLANASSETTSAATLGVVTESIANGADGFITTSGIVNGLNTLAFNEGDLLWLGTTAGTFTATKPISPNHLVLIGYVIKKAGGNGSILVKIQNTQELEESSDVLFTSLTNKDFLVYESATDLWKNKSIATILGYTPANDASVVKLTGDQSIAGDKTFTTANRTTFQNADFAQIRFKNTGDLTKYLDIGYGSNGNIFSTTGLDFRVGGLTTAALSIASNENATFRENLTAKSFIKSGGTSSQFLKADGSVDSSTYALTSQLHDAVTIGTANGLSLSGQVLSLALASPTTRGALTSEDYNYFFDKVQGNGNQNYIPKYTLSGSNKVIGNSQIYDNGTNVGIGTASPSALLNVVGASDMSGTFETTGTNNAASLILKSGNGTTSGLYSYLRFINNNTNQQDWRIGTYGNNNFSFVNSKALSTPMILTTNGELLIGRTSSYGAGWQLAVEGNIYAKNDLRVDDNASFGGSVGIGTTSPVNPLTVQSNGSAQGIAILNRSGDDFSNLIFYNYAGTSVLGGIGNSSGRIRIMSGGGGDAYERLSITSGGNVGIGTTSPSVKLQVEGNSIINGVSGDDTLYLQKPTGATLAISGATGTTNKILIGGSNVTNPDMFVYVGGSERMRIFSDGNVSLGSSTPTNNGYRFQVNGGQYGTYLKGGDYGTGSAIANFVDAGGTSAMYVRGDNRVGIGTIGPNYKLSVVPSATYGNAEDGNISINASANGGTTSAPTTVGGIVFGDQNVTNAYAGRIAVIQNSPSNSTASQMRFYTNSGGGNTATNERMRITSGGDVGIGAVAPRVKLDVEAYTAFMSLSSGINSEATTPDQQIGGIDFRKHYALAIGASIRLLQAGGVNNYSTSHLAFYTNNGDTAFGTVPPEKMRIASNGNVLINTTTDAGYKLDVNGTGRFLDNLTVNKEGGIIGIDASNNPRIGFVKKSGEQPFLAFASAPFLLKVSSGSEIFASNTFTTVLSIATSGAATFSNTVTATGFFNSSDNRLKELIDYDYNVSDIKPISYLWKDSRDNKKHVGYSAQEVQKVMPDAVNEDANGMLSVNYIEVLVAKIAELENRIKQLEK